MRIQPINANQQQASFKAMKLPKLKTKLRVKPQLNPEQEQQKNYTQAVLFALAFCAAAFTKYFIDLCNGKHKNQAPVEVTAKQPAEQPNTNTYQLK